MNYLHWSPTTFSFVESKAPVEEKEVKPPPKLPDLEKYWKPVNEDATNFTGWTYLLQYVDQEVKLETHFVSFACYDLRYFYSFPPFSFPDRRGGCPGGLRCILIALPVLLRVLAQVRWLWEKQGRPEQMRRGECKWQWHLELWGVGGHEMKYICRIWFAFDWPADLKFDHVCNLCLPTSTHNTRSVTQLTSARRLCGPIWKREGVFSDLGARIRSAKWRLPQ